MQSSLHQSTSEDDAGVPDASQLQVAPAVRAREPWDICFFDEEEEAEEEEDTTKAQATGMMLMDDDDSDEDCGSRTDDIIALARQVHGIAAPTQGSSSRNRNGSSSSSKQSMSALSSSLKAIWRRCSNLASNQVCLFRLESGLYLCFLAAFLLGGEIQEGSSISWGAVLESLATALVLLQTTYLVVQEVKKQLSGDAKGRGYPVPPGKTAHALLMF